MFFIPAALAIVSAVFLLSPVIIHVIIPFSCKDLIVLFTPDFILSSTKKVASCWPLAISPIELSLVLPKKYFVPFIIPSIPFPSMFLKLVTFNNLLYLIASAIGWLDRLSKLAAICKFSL